MTDSQQPRRRGPYRRGVEQRRHVVLKATEEFARNGYTSTSLRSIAAASGISHPAVSQLFGTKEALLLAVLETWDEDLLDLFGQRKGIEFLRALSDLMRRHESERGIVQLFIVMSAEATDPSHPAHDFMVQRARRVRTTIERHLRQAMDNADLRGLDDRGISAAARELTAAMNGFELQWLLDDEQKPAAAFDDFLARWLRDLSAGTPTARPRR